MTRLTLLALAACLLPLQAVRGGASEAQVTRLRLGTATLLARSTHHDYEKATFSFEHGLRDDPGRKVTRNDWDLQFGNGSDRFHVDMVTDDRSRIVDLGAGSLDALPQVPPLPPRPKEDTKRRGVPVEAPARAGHVYLVHTKDGDSDHMAIFCVREHIPEYSVTIDWAMLGSRGGSDNLEPPLSEEARSALGQALQQVAERER